MNPNEEISNGLSVVQLPQTRLLDLNYDCLLYIFRYLNVQDLARASESCQSLKDVACEAFKYEWKDKIISLNTDWFDCQIATPEILRNFGNQLQKIHILFSENWNDHLFRMIVEKCSSVQLTEVYVSQMIGEDNIDRFKKKFTNLKRLGFANKPRIVNLNGHFPTLEAFAVINTPFDYRHISFIIRHPQLKTLTLEFAVNLNFARGLLEFIDERMPQLEQLELALLPGFAKKIGYRPEFFKNLKRLSIFKFGKGYEMRHLSISNEKVEQLEFDLGGYDSDVADFICHYKEVKKLSLHHINQPLDYKDLLKLNEHLPKLMEFEISSSCPNFNHQEIVKFVMGSKQLVTLIIEDRKLKNVLEVSEEIQRKLGTSKWIVDCKLSRNKLIIQRKYKSNMNH